MVTAPKLRVRTVEPPSFRTAQIRLTLRTLLLIVILLLSFAVLCPVVKSPAQQSSTANHIHPLPSTNLPIRPPTRHNWKFSNTPSFCKHIVANPQPRPRNCRQDWDTLTCEDGKVYMLSHHAQDYYLYTRHFSRLKRRGIYVDIATNHPKQISNTYFMDACMGWDGICVEANPRYFDAIKKDRSCMLIDTCVGDTEGEKVDFIMGHLYGGVSGTNKNLDTFLKTRETKTETLTCTRMDRVLEDAQVSVIDYLSLDVEGHELKVLKGFDWEHVIIKVMSIEGTESTMEPISELLLSKGYVRHTPTLDEYTMRTGRLGGDIIFIHRTVTFGDPR